MPLTEQDLHRFTGTERYYRHPVIPEMVCSDGVKFVIDEANAHWLLDAVVVYQRTQEIGRLPFQEWKLVVKADHAGVLTCEDGDGHIVLSQEFKFTDFPLAEVRFWVMNRAVYLPSEH